MQSIQQAKTAAKHLRQALARVGHTVRANASKDAIAHQAGFPSWQVYVKTLSKDPTVADLLTWLNSIKVFLGHRAFMIGVIDSQWSHVTTLHVSGFYVSNRERLLYLKTNTKSRMYGVISAYEIIRRLPKKTSKYNIAIQAAPELGSIYLRPDSLWNHWCTSPKPDNTGFANALLANSVLPAKTWGPKVGYCIERNIDLPNPIPQKFIEPENDIEQALLRAGATFNETKDLHGILMSFSEADRAFYTWAFEDVMRCRRARGEKHTATKYLLDHLKTRSSLSSLAKGCDEWTNLDIPWNELSFALRNCYIRDEASYRAVMGPLLSELTKRI